MKHPFFILLILLLFVSCSKDGQNISVQMPSVWKETDHYFSAGGPLIWRKTESGKEETIEFKANNEFSSSQQTTLNRYLIEPADTGSANLKLYEEGKTDTIRWVIYDITPNTMKVGFEGCVEGCGKRFTRQ